MFFSSFAITLLDEMSVNRGILRKKEGIVEKTDMLKLLFAWVLEF